MSSLVRFHQLTGPNQKKPNWSLSSNLQFKMDDIPTKTTICGKKYVSAVPWLRLTYDLVITNANGGSVQNITRELVNRALINQIQVDGTTLGTIVSAAHTKGNMLDTLEFIANNGKMKSHVYNKLRIPGNSSKTVRHEIAIPFGFFGCKAPLAMAPMTSVIRSGNIKIDAPVALPSGFLATVTVTGTVTASVEVLWRDEIIVAPGFQMTRFKSTATSGANSDTVVLNSFGANSTLVAVERTAAIAGLLWATSLLPGDGTGAGTAASITDMSGNFAGIEQTNDIYPIVKQLADEYKVGGHAMNYSNQTTDYSLTPGTAGGDPVTGASISVFTKSPVDVPYPLFETLFNDGGSNASTSDDDGGDISGLHKSAKFVPIFPPRRSSHIAKYPIADGNPSFQLSGTFTNPDHYCYLFGLYRWSEDGFRAYMDKLKEDGIGMFMYGTNDLTDLLKNAKKQPAQDINFSKAHFLPRKMVPTSWVEGK